MKFPLSVFIAFLAVWALGANSPAPSPTAPPQKTELLADDLDLRTVNNETRVLALRGPDSQVIMTGTNMRISCDRLEIIAMGVGDKTSTAPNLDKFKYLLATGNVVIVQGDREARCGRAEVLPQENKIILTEKPMVIDHAGDVTREEPVTGDGGAQKKKVVDHAGDWIQEGEEITMFRGERRVHVKKSHLEAPSLKDLGFDPKAPAPNAAPTPATVPGGATTPPATPKPETKK